jgi:hypothetical protein
VFRTHKQPLGQVTRGKTAAVRLRRLDRFLLRTEPMLAWRHGRWAEAAFVDLGYGWRPTTTMELATVLRQRVPRMPVIGIEIEPDRVDAAAPWADENTRFVRGGFEVPVRPRPPIRLLRAMNVLRQYGPEAVADAHAQMLAVLEPGGLLVEGTSSPSGHRMVVNLLRKRAEGAPERRVLFSANLRHPLASPRDLQPVLPKDRIHAMGAGTPIAALMADWERAWLEAHATATFGTRVHFAEAGRALMNRRSDIEYRPTLLRQGYLVWHPPA